MAWLIYAFIFFVGYGNLAPHTEFGKLSVIAYALVGIPLMFLMLQGLGQHLTILSNKVNKLKLCSRRPAVNRYVNMVLIILLGVSFLFAGPTVLFMYVEGWSLMEGLYYCFVTLSTIGFGDYITGNLRLPASIYILCLHARFIGSMNMIFLLR